MSDGWKLVDHVDEATGEHYRVLAADTDELERWRAQVAAQQAVIDRYEKALGEIPCNCQHVAGKQTYSCRRCAALAAASTGTPDA